MSRMQGRGISMDNSLTIINDMDLQQISKGMDKIGQFQKIVQSQLRQNHDFGIVPGTSRPVLLKPGAEKILMLMGIRSEFSLVDSSRDFENGFFQYMVKCSLYKGDMLITEGMGSCNNRESKYKTQDPFSIDNTILKMAKKRALVDASLLVGSLSDIFSQDLDDVDLHGEKPTVNKVATDTSGTITSNQARRMFALSKGNAKLVSDTIKKYGYDKSDQVQKTDYEAICNEIEAAGQ